MAKLVEVLARELSQWPGNAEFLTLSRLDNEIYAGYNLYDEDDTYTLDPRQYTKNTHDEDEAYPIVTRAMWQSERDRQKGGEWKRHRGGKCPVDSQTVVEIRQRNGDIEKFTANGFMWDHNGQKDDIMSYRVISQPQAEEVEVKDTTIGTLGYTVDIDTSPAMQALNELSAKWDQVESPFKWRDTVNELDAYIEEFTRERDALIERLASEGFALIPPVVSVVSEFSGVDMSDWRNWKAGDVVESREKEEDIHIGEYYVLTEDVDPEDGEVYFNDSNGDDRHRDANKYRFISRP